MDEITLKPIGTVHCSNLYKFEAPRQGIYASGSQAQIHLEKDPGLIAALSDLAGFERIWVLFLFHQNHSWKPKVTPPVCGNKKRYGVFATRSPHRPNPIGLSCVTLLSVQGNILQIADHDLLDGTPVLDIKPYIPYADCHPDAAGGFTDHAEDFILNVNFPAALLQLLPENKREVAIAVLSHDPRPSYQRSVERIYGLTFAGYDIRFRVEEKTLYVIEVNAVHDK